MSKKRIDVLLVEKGLCDSREKAKRIIMAGLVYIKEVRYDKPGQLVAQDSNIHIKGKDHPYVSRGGLKLEKAIRVFNFDVTKQKILDIGASTGGFTDCLLQNGALKVFAVDVGRGQLDYKLRIDERVVCLEKTNFRNMPFDTVGEKVSRSVMNVSFISILKLIDNLNSFLTADSESIFLIKPQFEAERKWIGKNGVVSDKKVHQHVVHNVSQALAEKGFFIKGLDYSPIKGPKGNIEFLCYTDKKLDSNKIDLEESIIEIVDRAHMELKHE